MLAFHEQYVSPCNVVMLQAAAKVTSAWVPILAEGYARKDAVYAQVVTRKLTFGEANREIAAVSAQAEAKAQAMKGEILGGLERSHAAEMAARERAALALLQWSYQQQVLAQNQQAIDAMTRSHQTTCEYVGAVLNCTTF